MGLLIIKQLILSNKKYIIEYYEKIDISGNWYDPGNVYVL